MYFVTSGHLEPTEMESFTEWVQSGAAEDLRAQIEEEANVRYVDTYFSILGFGEYAYETWWELPDWAALDAMRESDAATEHAREALRFVDQTRSTESRVLRTPDDVKVTQPEE